MKIIKCRIISRGIVKGQALVSKDSLSFLGGVDPDTGEVVDAKHELNGKIIKDKILVIAGEPIIATGAIMAGIPMVDQPEAKIMDLISTGMEVEVDAEKGEIKISN
jgi:predicted aconitase with swiveling domain